MTCQNDHMAGGVLEALAPAAAESRRPEIARIPVSGCDGAPQIGQRMTHAATSFPALETLAPLP